jgi:hypothetical protein
LEMPSLSLASSLPFFGPVIRVYGSAGRREQTPGGYNRCHWDSYPRFSEHQTTGSGGGSRFSVSLEILQITDPKTTTSLLILWLKNHRFLETAGTHGSFKFQITVQHQPVVRSKFK